MSSRSFRTDPERLEKLIEEATVDCYDEEEQHSGLLTMIEDEVVFPFDARVIGEIVQITGMAWPDHGVGLQFTEWVEPLPEGFEWIEAYFAWSRYL